MTEEVKKKNMWFVHCVAQKGGDKYPRNYTFNVLSEDLESALEKVKAACSNVKVTQIVHRGRVDIE